MITMLTPFSHSLPDRHLLPEVRDEVDREQQARPKRGALHAELRGSIFGWKQSGAEATGGAEEQLDGDTTLTRDGSRPSLNDMPLCALKYAGDGAELYNNVAMDIPGIASHHVDGHIEHWVGVDNEAAFSTVCTIVYHSGGIQLSMHMLRNLQTPPRYATASIYTMPSFVAAISSASTSGVSLAKAFFCPSGLSQY